MDEGPLKGETIQVSRGFSRLIGDRLETDTAPFHYTIAGQDPAQPGLPQSSRVDEMRSSKTPLKLHMGVADENMGFTVSALEGHIHLGRGVGPKTTLFPMNGITVHKTHGQTLPFNDAGPRKRRQKFQAPG